MFISDYKRTITLQSCEHDEGRFEEALALLDGVVALIDDLGYVCEDVVEVSRG